jgi:hypothetical protein
MLIQSRSAIDEIASRGLRYGRRADSPETGEPARHFSGTARETA